jgi:hypothetical protein
MSRLEPKNIVDAFCYQLEDDIKTLRATSFVNKKSTLESINRIEMHLDILKNKLNQNESTS